MKKLWIALWGVLLILTMAWLTAMALPETLNLIAVRNLLLQYSGILAIGVMSVAMLLATRPLWLESWIGGMDKAYRLHKWLGISALIIAICHWLLAMGSKWLTQLGILERHERSGPPPGGEELGTVAQFLRDMKGPAEGIGEWAFYIVVLLIVLALIKRFPYRIFAKTHKVIAFAYLALVFHALILIDSSYWSQPVGWIVALLLISGTISALLILLRRVGTGRRSEGTIERLQYFPKMRVLETEIKLDANWQGHQAGQFAFVTNDKKEGHHPFTIASEWNPEERRIVFISKALGDYTTKLPDALRVGNKVNIEGPYGRFTFQDQKQTQIWIGGGIGITPFIARMKELAQQKQKTEIVLIHSVTTLEETAQKMLIADAQAAGIQLHIMLDERDGFLDGPKLRDLVPQWQTASVWFCGPAAFGKALRKDLFANGFAPTDFHQELFEMR